MKVHELMETLAVELDGTYDDEFDCLYCAAEDYISLDAVNVDVRYPDGSTEKFRLTIERTDDVEA